MQLKLKQELIICCAVLSVDLVIVESCVRRNSPDRFVIRLSHS